MDQPVIPFDLHRMFLGTDPSLFYGEIVVRTLIVYAYALALLRWLGGRTVGQLSTIEFLLVIALGSAVGDALFYPEVPLLHAMLVITLLVLCDKALDLLVARVPHANAAIDENPTELVRDGIIQYRNLERALLAQNEFFQQLRQHHITDTGEIRRAYLEYNGSISIFRYDDRQPRSHPHGLVIAPPWEVEPPEVRRTGQGAGTGLALACQRCAYGLSLEAGEAVPPCPNCGHETFSVVASPHASAGGAASNRGNRPPETPR